MKQIAQGAEARLFKTGNIVVKDRFVKSYRHPVLDSKLRKSRTKREAKVLQKVSGLIPGSEFISSDESSMKIEMKFVHGSVLKNIFDKNYGEYSKLIGRNVASLHNNDIIHGDLTTSNMIMGDDLHFIDFGLSTFSDKVEDKAVDLHLLKQALESKHHKVFDAAFEIILNEYKKGSKKADDVIKRLDIVEKRGRHKQQY